MLLANMVLYFKLNIINCSTFYKHRINDLLVDYTPVVTVLKLSQILINRLVDLITSERIYLYAKCKAINVFRA